MIPVLELRGIQKRFGLVQALRGADFTLVPGEVHALLGENGAGKSTLMHVAAGLLHPDAGEIYVRGRATAFRSPRDAREAGVGLVHQHFTAIPALAVAENIALAAGWKVSRPGELAARVRELAERVGLALDPSARTGELTVGARQRLEVVKALATGADILLLDEPTAVLVPSEADDVLARVRAFASAGAAAVLITHKLDEALAVADRVTVLRAGRVVRTGPARAQSPAVLAAAMLGKAEFDVAPPRMMATAERRPSRIRCRNLSVGREDRRGVAVRGADLEVAGGEIVGVAGVEGSGQRELLRAIAGLLPVAEGTLEVAQPVGFVPEDRTTEGLIGELSVAENVALGIGRPASWKRRTSMDWPGIARRTAEIISRYQITAAGVTAPAASLSGGNQQKVVVARALECGPRVVVAENPTRGLDVHAAQSVWAELRRAASSGAAVLVWCSDLDELLEQAGRIVVVARGRLREAPGGADRNAVGAMMLTADAGSPGPPA